GGDRLGDPIETVDGILVDDKNTGGMREQVGAAREGAIDMDALAGNRFGDLGGGDVLGNVAGLQPSDHNLVDAGGLQSGGLGRSDRRALFEDKPGLTDGVHGGRAERLLDRHRAEFHDAAVAAAGGATRSPKGCSMSAAACSRSVTCAMIATAISAGEIAPISSPIGAWMRAISVSLKPCALSRSTRRA